MILLDFVIVGNGYYGCAHLEMYRCGYLWQKFCQIGRFVCIFVMQL